MEIKEIIANIRKEEGLTQAQLAKKLYVTRQAVSKWECGNAIPDIDLLLELSHIYHVSVNEMLEDNDLILKLTDKQSEIDGITYFTSKTENEKKLCLGKRD